MSTVPPCGLWPNHTSQATQPTPPHSICDVAPRTSTTSHEWYWCYCEEPPLKRTKMLRNVTAIYPPPASYIIMCKETLAAHYLPEVPLKNHRCILLQIHAPHTSDKNIIWWSSKLTEYFPEESRLMWRNTSSTWHLGLWSRAASERLKTFPAMQDTRGTNIQLPQVSLSLILSVSLSSI